MGYVGKSVVMSGKVWVRLITHTIDQSDQLEVTYYGIITRKLDSVWGSLRSPNREENGTECIGNTKHKYGYR